MKKIGILGGTFNPVHKGHLRIAERALSEFNLDGIVFVPSGTPPHKSNKNLAPGAERLRMMELAVSGNPKFSVSKTELDRPGYSYAIDTFNEFRKKFGGDAELYYIMGMDSINDILSWKKPLELFRLCRFIVATRPGARKRTFNRLMKFPPLERHSDKIDLIEVEFDVSSTEIRDRIRTGEPISGLVPESVEKYVREKGLYR